MSILSTFYTSYSGLQTSQTALSVTGNNISNVNTDGYSKQTVNLSAASNNTTGTTLAAQADSGLGAAIESISRNKNSYLDNYYRTENSTYSYYDELSTNASLVNTITDELNGTGLTTTLSKFYSAASDLSNDPTDNSVRTNFISKAQAVCDSFNSTSSSLTELRKKLVGDIFDPNSLTSSTINSYSKIVNDYLDQLANLNKSINQTSSSNSTPNDLLDKRDQILDKLSSYLPITTTTSSNNLVSVFIAGRKVVEGSDVLGKLNVSAGTTSNPAIVSIVNAKSGNPIVDDITSVVSSGKISAVLELGGSSSTLSIGNILNNLDYLATNFANTVNSIQLYTNTDASTTPDTYTASASLDNSTDPATLKKASYNIFVDGTDTNPATSPGTTASINASTISINKYVSDHPSEIAAAIVKTTDNTTWTPSDTTATGNNNAALKFSSLRSTSILALGTTASGYAENMAGSVGTKISSVNNSLDSTKSVVDEITTQKNSTSGVNLDEELSNLTLYQRMYESAAKVFSVVNEIMQILIKMG
ncbi:MAG: flagellar hook-associated protein FlgK [Candidatus Gastranaerophilaceae bacterium]|jgi:flagellar hook-associated protein 1 FlgK